MYTWATLRKVLIVLMILPLAHFMLTMANDMRDLMEPTPQVWADAVAAYELEDSRGPLPSSPMVVLGGRQAILWKQLDAALFPLPVLNRGIGSANLDDVSYYFDRLATPYQPGSVLLVPGHSDFIFRDYKDPREFLTAIKGLAAAVAKLKSLPRLYVLTVMKWPSYPQSWDTVAEVNRALAQWADANDGVTLIDARTLTEDRNGEPLRKAFRNDGIFLNDWGYERLSLLLQEQIRRDYPHYY
jgi:hypothetical protein